MCTPIFSLRNSNCFVGSGLVSKHVMSVTILNANSLLLYKISGGQISCLNVFCILRFPGFWIKLIADLLSHQSLTGFLGLYPISDNKCHNHSLSLTFSLKAISSDSAVDNATQFCLELHHEMQAPANNTKYPEILVRSFSRFAKLASV